MAEPVVKTRVILLPEPEAIPLPLQRLVVKPLPPPKPRNLLTKQAKKLQSGRKLTTGGGNG